MIRLSFKMMTNNMLSASIINLIDISNNITIYKIERNRC